MKETELKILNIHKQEIIKQIESLGAKNIGEFFIIEEHFDFEDGRIKKRDELLRIRTINEKAELCYKKKIVEDTEFKVREEIETEIENIESLKKIFSELGLSPFVHREKKRTSFSFNSVRIEIDEYPSIPPYIEIEGSEEDIRDTLKKLNISMEQTTSMSATAVLKHCGVDPKIQKFNYVS